MSKTRNNHYVPQWYQRGFLLNSSNQLHYLDLDPETTRLPDGRVITMNDRSVKSTSQCFYQTDLYTTFFGEYINDEIERRLFGDIDDIGSRSVRAFIQNDTAECHRHFIDFFSYIDSQKIRTPKGLDWIRKHYPNLNQVELMMEMQAIREMHCTIWIEGVREIVSAKKSEIKFILTDHPVTIYNRAFSPESEQCAYPDDPSIAPKGTQTLFPLDKDHCLILTNYEYAKDPDHENPLEKRTNARFNRNTITKTDALIRTRSLNEEEVTKINYVLKQRARRYIASFNKDWLFPEKTIATDWAEIHKVLLPPATEVHHFGGEIYVGYKDGSTHYQDAFGRTTPENKHLKKTKNTKVGRNDPCGCGSEKKYKKCCLKKGKDERPSWDARSIRERNLFFCYAVADILGLSKGKTWNDVRRELSNDQVKEIHGVYEFLWPPDTDIFSLLPKPDNELRALYTGIVDPRVISTFALGFTPYFNEVIIQHPFIHPTFVKPEFSPFESPHQHKQQTLKNVLLLLTLEPFIEAGFVNFIPNPCSFDQHLFRQMLSMADERSKHIKIGEKEMKLMEELNKEDIKRSIRMMPREIQKRQIVSTMPDLSSEQTEEMIKYTESLNMKDPFSLLQKDVFCDQGGQLTVTSMAPNFEISLFIAQATGSIILTDSPFRWKELKSAQHKVAGMTSYPWNNLSSLINSLKFAVTANPEISFYQRGGDDFKNLRKTLKEIYSTIQNNEGPLDANIMRRFKEELLTSHEIAMKKANNQDQYNFDAKVSSLAPKGGFVHNNVQRMLLTSGIEKHLNSVPMAMFVEHA